MGNGSKKAGAGKPKFGPETKKDRKVDIVIDEKLSGHFSGNVSISLKYFKKSCECLSDWRPAELKKFSGTIEKVAGFSPEQLRMHKPLCDSHKGPPHAERFSRPSEIGDDMKFWEIKVDPHNKARMHGFFHGSVFFLVWLDHNHECFP